MSNWTVLSKNFAKQPGNTLPTLPLPAVYLQFRVTEALENAVLPQAGTSSSHRCNIPPTTPP